MKNNNSHNVEIITPLVQQKKISQATFTRTEASEVLEHHQEVTEPKNENTKRLLKNTALQRLHEKDYRAPVCLWLTRACTVRKQAQTNSSILLNKNSLNFTYIKLNCIWTVLLYSLNEKAQPRYHYTHISRHHLVFCYLAQFKICPSEKEISISCNTRHICFPEHILWKHTLCYEKSNPSHTEVILLDQPKQ